MKKAIYLFVAVMMTGFVHAQTIVTDFQHENGKYFNFHNIVETNDGNLIVECPMFEPFVYGNDIGVMFYKISSDGQLLDSLLIRHDNVPLRTMFDGNPNVSQNHIFALYDNLQDRISLRMTYIDDNLNVVNTINVLLEDTPYPVRHGDCFVDKWGDIIASYCYSDDEGYKTSFARIGFDGTLKYKRVVPEIRQFNMMQTRHSGPFSDNPIQYCYWGSNDTGNDLNQNPPIRNYVLDSLFNVVDDHGYYQYGNDFYGNACQEHIIPFDDEHYLMVTSYSHFVSAEYDFLKSVLLAKFDMNHQMEAIRFFAESRKQPVPIQAETFDDNTIYYSYMDCFGENNHLVLACLDSDLNVRWERHFLEENEFHWGTCMKILSDKRIAIGSYRYTMYTTPNGSYPAASGNISVVIIKDDYDDIPELGISIRPYAFYPNPVRDELNLRYSPDVQPQSIELYDLQGRQLLRQSNYLESVDMQSLAAGQYMIKVVLTNGKAYTDKVVKE